MSATRPDEDWGATRVSVFLAERSGWTLLVESDGQIVATEHHNDWHRVERRRRLLEAKTRQRLARVAAALVVTATVPYVA